MAPSPRNRRISIGGRHERDDNDGADDHFGLRQDVRLLLLPRMRLRRVYLLRLLRRDGFGLLLT
jgi:hypothetical protein